MKIHGKISQALFVNEISINRKLIIQTMLGGYFWETITKLKRSEQDLFFNN